MFDSLKSKIVRENMQLIKKKSRYAQDELDFVRIKSQLMQQVRQHENSKQLMIDEDKPLARCLHLSVGKNQSILQHNQQQQSSISSDSLSDYELEERQEVFNYLIQKPQSQHKSATHQYQLQSYSHQYSPLSYNINNSSFPKKPYQDKEFIIQTNNYYSPQSSIKKLQHLVELSQQKLKLTKDSHHKDIQSLYYKHSLTVQEMNVRIQQLELMVKSEDNKRVRIQEIQKQNKLLKQSLQSYEQKYWRYQTLQSQLSKAQTENKMLTIQLVQMKNQLQMMQSINTKKQNTSQNNQHHFIHTINHNEIVQNQENQQQLRKTITKLQNKLKLIEQQLINDKSDHQKQIHSYQNRIAHLQSQLNHKTKIIQQSYCKIDQLLQEKQKVEKSLLQTMDSFSKHLQNESAHISQTKLNKMSPQKYYKRETQMFLKPNYQIYEEETINLDLNQSLKQHKTTQRQLQSISPVHIKHSAINENQQYLTRNDYIPKPHYQRTRIMSHQQHGKLSKHNLVNDPEKQLTNQSKISKLEKKLQIANIKIVQLLKQKLQQASNVTFR